MPEDDDLTVALRLLFDVAHEHTIFNRWTVYDSDEFSVEVDGRWMNEVGALLAKHNV